MTLLYGNIFEKRTQSIAEQLQNGRPMAIDYDQLLVGSGAHHATPSTQPSCRCMHLFLQSDVIL
jgi:hypothetical protein